MATAGDALGLTSTDTTRATEVSATDQPLTRRERREREAAAAAATSRTGAVVLSALDARAAVVAAAAPVVRASEAPSARVASSESVGKAVESQTVASEAVAPERKAVPVAAAPVTRESAVVPAAFRAKPRAPRIRLPRKRTVAGGFVMVLAAGMFATTALPAYAYGGGGSFDAQATSTDFGEEQTLQIPNATAILTVSRDGYVAPSPEELAAAQAAAEAAAAAMLAAEQAATASTASSSSGGADITVNPPSGPYSGAAVIAYAQQFVGVVPYSAGNTPASGFSCDGLTQYVMGQFGISLPRGVSAQAAQMVRIDAADAQPGDFLVYPGQHIGFYAGGGMMIDSPDWGRYVEYRPIWGSPYYARYVG